MWCACIADIISGQVSLIGKSPSTFQLLTSILLGFSKTFLRLYDCLGVTRFLCNVACTFGCIVASLTLLYTAPELGVLTYGRLPALTSVFER
jgi:hypothetical protein